VKDNTNRQSFSMTPRLLCCLFSGVAKTQWNPAEMYRSKFLPFSIDPTLGASQEKE
jgi:hypothetical protein